MLIGDMGTRPSLKTVAAAAGVSVSSASNAYNRPGQLSDEVRERIFRVASEQGYSGPDTAARTLRGKRAGAIGVLLTERLSYAFSDPYSVGMLAGLAEVAEESATSVTLIPIASHHREAAAAVERAVNAVQQAVVDGVVAYCVDADHPAREVLRRRGLPVVSSSESDEPDAGLVLIDERAAAASVGRLLRELGHTRVVEILEGTDARTAPDVVDPADAKQLYQTERERLAGFRAGLGDAAEITVVAAGRNVESAGYAAAELALDSPHPPTALLAHSDVLALGALRAVLDRGLVPGVDVSVTGFDDIPAAAAAGLTTVTQEIQERGRLLGRMLLDPSYTLRRVVLPTTLQVRRTTGPARH